MKNTILLLFVIALCISVLGLMIYSFISLGNEFFEISISSGISLIVAIVMSFFIVQRQTDKRRQKEIFVNIIESLLLIIENPNFFSDNMGQEEILMQKRIINNKIYLIEKYIRTFFSKNYAESKNQNIQEVLDEYIGVIDNYISQSSTSVKEIKTQIQRPIRAMSQYLLEVMFDLYK